MEGESQKYPFSLAISRQKVYNLAEEKKYGENTDLPSENLRLFTKGMNL